MNIKQASDASGISSRNIRYYEQAGLLCPARDPQNDYRTYTEQDIRTLKLIRMLRMLGVPLEEIRPILQGEVPLYRAAEQQAQRLQQQAQELEAARRFCCQLQENHTETASLDVDACLAHMQTTAADGWFTGWLRDYRTMTRAEHRYSFTFTPDLPVTTPAEFTDALFAYAKEQNLNLVVTKEGMVPHFTIDGVEYRAIRRYYPFRGIPTARIRCVLCDPDFFAGPNLPADAIHAADSLCSPRPGGNRCSAAVPDSPGIADHLVGTSAAGWLHSRGHLFRLVQYTPLL